jgi:hypothetical protein
MTSKSKEAVGIKQIAGRRNWQLGFEGGGCCFNPGIEFRSAILQSVLNAIGQ